MLSKGYKIVSPKTFEIFFENIEEKEDEAIIKIEKASICKADIRYYLGARDKNILGLKYPLRLIHEAVGIVLRDKSGNFKVGDRVVLIPNIVKECYKECNKCKDSSLGENYCPYATFVSSNSDGFSCEFLSYPVKNMIKINSNIESNIAVFSELSSVAFAALRRVDDLNNKTIAVWGDGVVGYILCSVLKNTTRNSKIIIVGNNKYKLDKFPCDEIYLSSDELKLYETNIDIAFECVGGEKAQNAIKQILNVINIGGKIVLTGVSENNIEISTRKILEKGLSITGSTRSSILDFKKSIELMENSSYSKCIEKLFIDELNIENIIDYYDAFEKELENKKLGKYILNFNN